MSKRYAPLRRSDVDRAFRQAAEAARLDRVMREQIATAQPCADCGDCGHDAADHDELPTPAQLDLEHVLRGSLQ